MKEYESHRLASKKDGINDDKRVLKLPLTNSLLLTYICQTWPGIADIALRIIQMVNQIEPGGPSSHGTQNKPVLYMNNHVALVHMILKNNK